MSSRIVRRGVRGLAAAGFAAAVGLAALGAGAGSAGAAPDRAAPDRAAPDRAAQQYPVVTDDVVAAIVTGDAAPAGMSPPGSNVAGCRSAAPPVVLLHGTAQTQMSAWQYLAPTLANRGFCVYSLTYGQASWSGQIGALASREGSAKQVADFVDDVLRTSGAAQVDLVGYSQGSAIAQLVSQEPGKAAQIRHLIGLGPSNKGVSKVGSLTDRLPARAPGENDWGPTHPGIDYLMVMTRYDEIASPYTNGFLPAAPNVRNVVVQDRCPDDRVGHLGLPYDRWVGDLVSNTLSGSRALPERCASGLSF